MRVVTTDVLIDNVHFRKITTSSTNLSDLAAMNTSKQYKNTISSFGALALARRNTM